VNCDIDFPGAWRETAHKIEDRFPKGTEVVAQFRPE